MCGPQILTARRKLGLTQLELSAKCQLHGLDVTRGTIAKIEAQIRCVADFEVVKLSQILGVTEHQLLHDGRVESRKSKEA